MHLIPSRQGYLQILVLVSLIFFVLFSRDSFGQDIYFAGFSFIGDESEDENYPVAIGLYKGDKLLLDRQLQQSMKRLQRKDLNINSEGLGRIKSGNAVVLAYGLQRESIAVYQIEQGFQYQIQIVGLIYVFDFADQEKKLLASYPTGVSVTVDSAKKLGREDLNKYVENLYVPNRHNLPAKILFDNGASDISVFDVWVASLENAKIRRAAKETRLQIRNIELDEKTQKQLHEKSEFLKNSKVLITETARNLERNLSTNQQVPMIPFASGRALGSSMIGRFSDTNYEINLPKPDFVIDVLVREFKKTEVKNKVYDGWVYGAFITLKLIEPFNGTVMFESKFNFKDEIQFPSQYQLVIEDDWPLWLGAQKKLFEILSKQISAKDEATLATITNTPNIKQELYKLEDVIARCR